MLFVTLITLFGGYLVKIYAWKSILGRDGILNMALTCTGLLEEPFDAFIYSTNAVVITLTYFLLPFAVLPIYGACARSTIRSRRRAISAHRRCGDARHRGAAMRGRHRASPSRSSFLISAGDYVTPRFVGGGASMMGHFIETQFSIGFDWPMGSAMSFTVLATSLPGGAGRARRSSAGCSANEGAPVARLLWRGFVLAVVLFMLLPLFLVVLFSFNAVRAHQPAADRPHA